MMPFTAPPSQLGVSIIIPLFNKEATITRAIHSALAQEGVDKEIIIVDDGSTDRSAAVVAKFASQVTYIQQDNSGPSAARNRGAIASRFPVLTFLDADDELLPGTLSAHIACRQCNPALQATFGSFRIFAGNELEREEIIYTRSPEIKEQEGYFIVPRFLSCLVRSQQSCFVNRALFDAVGGFDPRLRCWERTDFHFKVMLAAQTIGIPKGLHTVQHKDLPENSQLARASGNSEYAKIFAHNILKHIAEVAPEQRGFLLAQVGYAMYRLWTEGKPVEFKHLAQQASYWVPRDMKHIGRLCLYAKLPPFLLQAAQKLKSLMR